MKRTLYKTVFGLAAAMSVSALLMGCGTPGGKQPNTEQVTESATEETLEEKFIAAVDDKTEPLIIEEYAETEEYAELAAFLIEYYQVPEEYRQLTRYYYNYVDLNDDGIDEIMALVVGKYTSDSSGDKGLLLKMQEDGTFLVLNSFTGIHTPIMVCDEMVNGWHKIIYETYGGGNDTGYVVCHYEEDGGYQSDKNEFYEKLEPVSGIKILANNLIDDIDQGNYMTLIPQETE